MEANMWGAAVLRKRPRPVDDPVMRFRYAYCSILPK
jgi:hypothetical protein